MAFYTKKTDYDKNTDYSELINKAAQNGDFKSAAKYEQQRNAKIQGEGLNYKQTNDYAKYLEDVQSPTQTPTTVTPQVQVPTFSSTYDDQLNALYEQITGRPAFSYDVNQDALYQQYRDNYMAQGKAAMEDTMGQAAALTGGYGSTYAQNVGQQAYNAYLAQLDDIVPELYDRAKSNYDAETDRLLQQYSLAGDLRDREYNNWLGDYERQRDAEALAYERQQYADEQAYNRAVYEDETAYEREKYADETAYTRQNNAYDRLVSLITASGYQPSAEELAAAGMTESEAQAYRDYYASSLASGSSGSSGSGSGGSASSDTDELEENESFADYDYNEAESVLNYIYTTNGYDAWEDALEELKGDIPESDYLKLRAKYYKHGTGSGSGGGSRSPNKTQMPM